MSVEQNLKHRSRSPKSEVEKIKGQTWRWNSVYQNSYINYIGTHLIYRYHINIIVFIKQTAELELIAIVLTRVLKFNHSLPSSEIFINNP